MEIDNNALAQAIAQGISQAVAPLYEAMQSLQSSLPQPPKKEVWENPDWDGQLPENMTDEQYSAYWAWMDKRLNLSGNYGNK